MQIYSHTSLEHIIFANRYNTPMAIQINNPFLTHPPTATPWYIAPQGNYQYKVEYTFIVSNKLRAEDVALARQMYRVFSKLTGQCLLWIFREEEHEMFPCKETGNVVSWRVHMDLYNKVKPSYE